MAGAALAVLAILLAAGEPWVDAHTDYSGELFVASAVVACPALVLSTIGVRRTARGARGRSVALAGAVASGILLAIAIGAFLLLVVVHLSGGFG